MYVAHSGITDLSEVARGWMAGATIIQPFQSAMMMMIEVGRLTFQQFALLSYISSNTYDKTLPQSAFRGPDH